jgi:plasmid stability protein
MKTDILQPAEKRINLKVPADLHVRLKIQAAREGTSLQELITNWLKEKLAEGEPETAVSPVDPEWQERFRRLLAKAQSGDKGDLTPEELEHEVTLARDEVREMRRAGRR